MTECRGFDVSQYQAQSFPNWTGMAFGIARATYGTSLDSRALLHVAEMRRHAVKVGLYHFFCATRPVETQVQQFAKIWAAASPDLIPWVDVESYPGHTIGPSDVKPLLALLEAFAGEFGGHVGIYTSQYDWARLGRPQALLSHPLWVPHWPKAGARSRLTRPATPGDKSPVIWQCMVGPQPWGSLQQPSSPKAIDQDIAPNGIDAVLLQQPEPEETIRWEDLSEADWHSHHFGRDHTLDEA